jgi:hypothetical protein
MNIASGAQTTRRDFIKLMSSLGVVALTDTGCAFLIPVDEQPFPKIALRNPEQTGELSESQLTQLWEIFDYIGNAWETRELCKIHSLHKFEPIIDLKTTQSPSYLTEYQHSLEIFRQIREDLDPQQALHHLYFEHSDEHLKRFVIYEFLRLHIAYGGFRFLPYRNVVGFMGGSFSNDDYLPYRGLSDSC